MLKPVYNKRVFQIKRQTIKHPVTSKKAKKHVAGKINGTSSSATTFQLEIYTPQRPTEFLSEY